MIAKKKRESGGSLLLKTRGPAYFSELALKGVEKRNKAMKLWNKTQKAKKKAKKNTSAKSVKTQGKKYTSAKPVKTQGKSR